MSKAIIILQILLITIGMIIFRMVLNRILGLRKERMHEFKEKALNLQERIKNAQALGDIRLMAQLQRETMQLTRQIMVKQFIPMCMSCIIFLGIFIFLSFIYAEAGKYSFEFDATKKRFERPGFLKLLSQLEQGIWWDWR